MVMQHHKEISATRLEMLEEEIGFSGRDFELWFPVFVIARWLRRRGVGGIESAVRGLAERKSAARKATREEGPEETLRAVLHDLVDEKGGGEVTLSYEDIEEALQEYTGEAAPPRTVLGTRLKTLGLSPERRRVPDESGTERKVRVFIVSSKMLGRAA